MMKDHLDIIRLMKEVIALLDYTYINNDKYKCKELGDFYKPLHVFSSVTFRRGSYIFNYDTSGQEHSFYNGRHINGVHIRLKKYSYNFEWSYSIVDELQDIELIKMEDIYNWLEEFKKGLESVKEDI